MSSSSSPQQQFLRKLSALIALALVSLFTGFTMKKNQYNRVYPYSPLSVIVMTEVFKLFCSLFVLLGMAQFESRSLGLTRIRYLANLLKENITRPLLIAELRLAFMYTVLNVIMTHIFFIVSGSTFFSIKTITPIATALVLHMCVKRRVSTMQWATLVVQCIAILMTQINFCKDCTDENVLSYIVALIAVGISSVAGVYNEHLAKGGGTSLNVQNVVLSGFGIVLNYVVYALTSTEALGLSSGLGFFENWDYGVVTVIIANGSVGLVITAVYKYADVLVKYFALACSTSLLFHLEAKGILLRSSRGSGPMTPLLATIVILYAGCIYASLPSSSGKTVKHAKDDRTEVTKGSQTDDLTYWYYLPSYEAKINALLSSKSVVVLYLLTLTTIAFALAGYERCVVSCT